MVGWRRRRAVDAVVDLSIGFAARPDPLEALSPDLADRRDIHVEPLGGGAVEAFASPLDLLVEAERLAAHREHARAAPADVNDDLGDLLVERTTAPAGERSRGGREAGLDRDRLEARVEDGVNDAFDGLAADAGEDDLFPALVALLNCARAEPADLDSLAGLEAEAVRRVDAQRLVRFIVGERGQADRANAEKAVVDPDHAAPAVELARSEFALQDRRERRVVALVGRVVAVRLDAGGCHDLEAPGARWSWIASRRSPRGRARLASCRTGSRRPAKPFLPSLRRCSDASPLIRAFAVSPWSFCADAPSAGIASRFALMRSSRWMISIRWSAR